jgi:hypothetical protein
VSYPEERPLLVARLRKERPGQPLLEAVSLDGAALRFHLGTSLADLRVPVQVAPVVWDAMQAAVRDLFFLLSMRHRTLLRENEYDRLLLLDGFDPRSVRPVAYTAPASVKSEGVRRAFLEAPELHPALDSGLMASWLGSGKPGRVLAGALNSVLRRAATESASSDPPEPTAFIALLALRALSREALGTLRDLPVSGPTGRALNGAVAAGLLVLTRLASREAGISDIACEAATGVLPWLSGVRSVWGSGMTAWGVPFIEPPNRLEDHQRKLLMGGAVESVARDAHAELNISRDGARKAARQVALARLRSELLTLLRWAEIGRAPNFNTEAFSLPQLFGGPGVLERTLVTPALRKDLLARAKAAVKIAANDPSRALFESVARAAKEWKDEDPGSYVSTDQVVKTWSVAVASLAADCVLDRALDRAEGQIVHRLGSESESGNEEQHEQGKLYVFSLDQPILMVRARAPQMGHLFCDMKDFTKRTASLKETVVADFLSREFYGPILTAAARHAQGLAHLADKGGIYLNNLLGDAVSFSGDIVALIDLAEEIRRALASYTRRLATESSRESVSRTVQQAEEKFRLRSEELAEEIAAAEEAREQGTPDPISGEEPDIRLRALAEAQRTAAEERDTEIALASGEKLEAGIFISYGAAPEVATFEDHIFGPIKVSIAEKINESARGTARNAGVRARVDALLSAQRDLRGEPGLACPLQVAVAKPLSIPMPADVEVAVRQSVALGDLQGAESVIGVVVRDFVSQLAAQGSWGDRGDIYNGGAAVSEEALRAWIEARRGDYLFLQRTVDVDQLHPALRARFIFPMPTLRLVMAVSHSANSLQDLFVHVGRATFKGFEKQGGLGIYELIGRESRFFAMLAEYHLVGWLREADEQPTTGEWHPISIGGSR